MTDHSRDPGAATPHDGDYDPMIADRFRSLERITPPDITSPAMRMAVPGAPARSDPPRRRSGFLMAVAACVGVLMVGVVAVVAATRGEGTDLGDEAGDSGDVPVVAADTSDTTAPVVVEGDADVGSTTRVEPGSDGSDGSDAADEADQGSDAAADSGDGDPTAGDTPRPPTDDTGPSGGPPPTMPPDVSVPTTGGGQSVSTSSTATSKVPTTTGDDGSSDSAVTVTVRGTVTEVFTDCVSRLLLTETGQIVQGGPVTCDGGSYIVVDGTRVFTSSGFVSADLAFDKHPSNLKPGVEVVVTATRTGGASGPLTLACDACRVRII